MTKEEQEAWKTNIKNEVLCGLFLRILPFVSPLVGDTRANQAMGAADAALKVLEERGLVESTHEMMICRKIYAPECTWLRRRVTSATAP
jgi:hypothetical protein